MDVTGDLQPFPMSRFEMIQLKQPFINGCFGFQVLVTIVYPRLVEFPFVFLALLTLHGTKKWCFFFPQKKIHMLELSG